FGKCLISLWHFGKNATFPYFVGNLACTTWSANPMIAFTGTGWSGNIWKKMKSPGPCGIITEALGYSGKVSRDCLTTISIQNYWKVWILTSPNKRFTKRNLKPPVFTFTMITFTRRSKNRVTELVPSITTPPISPIMVVIAFDGLVPNNIIL